MNGLTEDQEFTDADRSSGKRYVWECAIGGRDPVTVPPGGDLPMRRAVEQAFFELTGEHAEYTYSGWGRKFTDKALSMWPVAERDTKRRTYVRKGFVYAAFVVGLIGGYIAGAY